MIPPQRRRIDPSSGKPQAHPDASYSILLPFLILLLTLVLSTGRDMVILYRHKISLVKETAQAARPLDDVAKEAASFDLIHADLERLALTDPVAARVVTDFFGSAGAEEGPNASTTNSKGEN